MKYFKLPDLGEGLTEAEIVKWHVKPGDTVKIDQLIVSVETAKAIVDIPSPVDGVIANIFGQEGDIIHTGEPLLEFSEGEDTGTVVGELKTEVQEADNEDHFIIGYADSRKTNDNLQVTPAVRSLAKRLEVDLNHVTPTGKNNLITPADVERVHQLTNKKGASEPLRGVRRTMAKNMMRSHQCVAPVTIYEDADINHWGDKPDITIRLIQAIAYGCQEEPILNSWFDGDKLTLRKMSQIDLGIAVDTKDGLFMPVLRNVANRTAEDLRRGLDQLRHDVKNRSIPPKELTGATIALSNFGTIAGRYANPIITPPMVAILGAGSIRELPVFHHKEIVPHTHLPLSLTIDHRALTGGEAARFLYAVISHLSQKPDISE